MSIITCGFCPSLHLRSSETRTPSISSSSIRTFQNQNQTLFWDSNRRMINKHYKNTRRFIVRSVVEPGAPLPPEPPFNFINWIVGIAVTVILPFFSHKWRSLLRIQNEVETAVEIAEEIVEAVEKVAEGVEKAAEDIAENLPEGGTFRKAVDFVEHVAERANKDAHIVGDFIDKVQEVEEKVEEYIESIAEKPPAMAISITKKNKIIENSMLKKIETKNHTKISMRNSQPLLNIDWTNLDCVAQ